MSKDSKVTQTQWGSVEYQHGSFQFLPLIVTENFALQAKIFALCDTEPNNAVVRTHLSITFYYNSVHCFTQKKQ